MIILLHASTLLSGAVNQSCCYCSQGHSADMCTVVVDGEARKKILRQMFCLFKGGPHKQRLPIEVQMQ